MAVEPERTRTLALSLPEASEATHWNRLAFRTPRRIYATLDCEARDLYLMFDPELRDFYCEQDPRAFSAVPGGWGRKGATRCLLDLINEPTLLSALKSAHRLAIQPPKARKP